MRRVAPPEFRLLWHQCLLLHLSAARYLLHQLFVGLGIVERLLSHDDLAVDDATRLIAVSWCEIILSGALTYVHSLKILILRSNLRKLSRLAYGPVASTLR